MNDLQKVEFNLLSEFISICEKLNISYFLVCGSALGAAKYNGFIPWDDDIDVALYREDYDKFMKEAPSLLNDNYFLQNCHTDREYPYIFSKLRNSNTTYIEKSLSKLKINHGVYIDIFPLDGYPSKRIDRIVFEIKKKWYKLLQITVLDANYSFKAKCLKKIFIFFNIDKKINNILKKYEKLISKYGVSKSKLICNHGNWQGKLEYAPKWHYGNGTISNFEGLNVRIPENFDAYLKQKYGDWKADLPEDKKIGHHYFTILDLTKSYKEYIKEDN